MIRSILEESKLPSLVVLSDQSSSVGSWLEDQDEFSYESELREIQDQLSEKFAISLYEFGEKVSSNTSDSLSFDDNITDISGSLQYVHDVYEGENLAGILLATDGIFNQGLNPLYSSFPSNIPIYCIALGDTSQTRDIVIQSVLHNEIAYLNDEMIVQVDIKANNASGQSARLTVDREQNGQFTSVFARNIHIRNDDFFITEDIQLRFDETGINHYRFRVSGLNNEQNLLNNRKDIYIDVLDARQEIGIIAAAPHPDISSIKQLLEQNENYRVQAFIREIGNSELANLDLVIFHNLPKGNQSLRNTVNSLDTRRIPRIFIVGSNTDLSLFNQLQDLVQITGNQNASNNSQAEINTSFENFTVSESMRNEVRRFPPLSSPFGEYSVNGVVTTLYYQNIGGISTNFPLLSFADAGGVKTAFLFGQDIWRWKLFDFLQNENFNVISELIDKVTVFVSTKEDRRKFRVSTNDNVFFTNEEVVFLGELYNDNYELINDPEVVVQLRDDDGNVYDYTFSKNNLSYSLEIGQLSPGRYSYAAETIFNGEKFEASGGFVVREIQIELYDLEAQHNLLYALAQKTQGSVYYPEELSSVPQILLDSNLSKPVIYQSIITKPLVDMRSILFLLFILLGIEWILRRYFGSL